MSQDQKSANGTRNPALDGLRGIAALVVVLWHIACVLAPAAAFGFTGLAHTRAEIALFDSPVWVLLNGNFAVVVFFALSGYVLTIDFFQRPDDAGLAKRATGRLIRLALPAGASILLVYVLQAFDLYRIKILAETMWAKAGVTFDTPFAFDPSIGALLNTALFATWFQPPDFSRSYNLVLWTMPVELWGSFLVLGLSLLLHRAAHRTAMLCVVALVLALAVPDATGIYLGTFVLGCAVASQGPRGADGIASWCWLLIALEALLLGAHHGPLTDPQPPILHIQSDHAAESLVMRAAGARLLLVAALKCRPLAGLLAARPCRFLGRVSFALYLLHQPILYSLGASVALRFDDDTHHVERLVATTLVVLIVSLIAAHVFECRVDRPSVRLARALAERLISGRATSHSMKIRQLEPSAP